MTALGMISALIIRNAHRPRRSLQRTEPGWKHICGQRESEYSHARPYCHRLSFPLPSQRIGQTAAVVAWLPEQGVQRARALRVQRQAIFSDDTHAGVDLVAAV